ncbi:MAG: hypothetical protein GF383_16445 [Candidatus Lokiarchaeota archaeon]|nr:hypothetical protein [Candidatus Lokiarchaeota archaeon]
MRILNWANPPKEGVFTKGSKTWKYTHRRFWNAFFAIWIARALPFPWADIIAYRLLGIKIGKNVVSYEGYIDPVFIDIGDYTMTSLNICIFSHLIFHDKIYIKKVRVGKGCIVGPHSIITPGTIMEERAILGANSLTKIGQKLEGNLIHVGSPVNKHFPIQSVEESIAKVKSLEKEPKKQDYTSE